MDKSRENENLLYVANDIFFKEVNDYLSDGREVLFTINGNSMRPFLTHGDKVSITPTQKEHLTYGRIILAKCDFGYVLHRIVWIYKDNVWLAGDNNLVQLEKVNKRNILGSVKYALVGGEQRDMHSYSQLILAYCWFLLRPFRLVLFKLKRLL